jgi:hypothetical protein
MKASLLASAALLGTCGTALGQPYASAHLGYSNAEFPIEAPFNGYVDDSGLLLGLTVGMGLGRDWAIELGWNTYDGFDGRGTPCPGGAVCPAVIVDIPSNDQRLYNFALVRRFTLDEAEIYGKAGYYHAKVDGNIALPDSDFVGRGLMLGIGARWYFSEPWSIAIEGVRFDDNVSQVTVGFGWGMRPSTEREETLDEREQELERREEALDDGG